MARMKKDDPSRAFPDKLIRHLDEAHLARARLLHVESLLDSPERVREWLQDEDVDASETIRGLRARRMELLEQVNLAILNAGFHPWEMQLFPPGGWPDPRDASFHAKVHYRYTPAGPVISP